MDRPAVRASQGAIRSTLSITGTPQTDARPFVVRATVCHSGPRSADFSYKSERGRSFYAVPATSRTIVPWLLVDNRTRPAYCS